MSRMAMHTEGSPGLPKPPQVSDFYSLSACVIDNFAIFTWRAMSGRKALLACTH